MKKEKIYNEIDGNVSEHELELRKLIRIYDEIVGGGFIFEYGKKLVEELLAKQKEDGSWAVVDVKHCDGDIRVIYGYFPTYYATAALISMDNAYHYASASKEKEALLKGLNFALGRGLYGHGYTATRQMLDALKIYRRAGLYKWIKNNKSVRFSEMIEKLIINMRENVDKGCTVSDWCEDFAEDYKSELAKYESGIADNYVWYACYGSNINSERFMEYINKCEDKTPPAESRPYMLCNNVFFAKTSVRWGGGKAFLDDSGIGKAYGKIYKITKEQFETVKNLEGKDYTKKLYLGECDGCSVYTFTDENPDMEINMPSAEYFEVIYKGLADCYQNEKNKPNLAKYLISAIMPYSAFVIARIIKKSEHSVSLSDIFNSPDVDECRITSDLNFLLRHNIICFDKRYAISLDVKSDAHFYTVNSRTGRGLIEAMLKYCVK